MRRHVILLLATASIVLCHTSRAAAQCEEENTAFQAGEELRYDLYFNWKFVWLNAGTATMATDKTQWEGRSALRSHLITKSSKRIDRFFTMRDTLQAVVTPRLVPLYYKKAANEGGKYYVDQVWYSYGDGKTRLRQQYQNRKGEVTRKTAQSDKCVSDMMSMMMRARSLSAEGLAKGDKIKTPMADGSDVEEVTLVYRGKKTHKMRGTGVRYRCLVFSFVEYEGKKEKEIITFYVTDDSNHVPVRLDMFLKFGTAKAYLSSSKGLRRECEAVVKG